MDTSVRARPTYRLEDLTIDVGTAQVLRHGQLVPLPRLSFDLLVALCRAAPNLVTVDELMSHVWPGVVVNAETVSQRVKLLRIALEDDPRKPRYIGVSRGRGYRIVAPVTTLEPVDGAAPPASLRAEPPSPAGPPALVRKLRWPWMTAAALALAGITALYLRPAATPEPIALPDRSVAVLPFDNLGQSPQDAALAFGVAETLLHRLSASKELTVIARQSSFSFGPRGADVREIGRKLNARYLIEGSLQSTPTRLRITAQLIDASTGGHVWSLQFDRKPEDIFVVQDEIAARVTEAMQLSVASATLASDAGTQDFDAYLAYAQGRTRLATTRVADAKLAIGDFERAIRVDPKFTRAYAALAEARLEVADGEMSRERGNNIRKVQESNLELLQKALAINDRDADTHLQLAENLWEGEPARQELSRALELNPNSAAGYRLLALMRMYRDRLPDEAMLAIDKARFLSPLEVLYDNEKARIALYGKSDVAMAEQLSRAVLERDPASSAALWRLGEIQWCCRGEYARGVTYLEQALQRDPDHEFGRRIIMRAYLDLGDAAEAQAIAANAPHPVGARLVPVLVYAQQWREAAERTYQEAALGTTQGIEADLAVMAVRVDARATGQYQPALEYLTRASDVTWDDHGNPSVPDTWSAVYSVGLADLLLQSGERERAAKLFDLVLNSIDDEANRRHRGDRWFLRPLAVAYAVLGRDDEALSALERSLAIGQLHAFGFYLDSEPAFEHLHALPRYQALVAKARQLDRTQRGELDRLRAAGLVSHRAKK